MKEGFPKIISIHITYTWRKVCYFKLVSYINQDVYKVISAENLIGMSNSDCSWSFVFTHKIWIHLFFHPDLSIPLAPFLSLLSRPLSLPLHLIPPFSSTLSLTLSLHSFFYFLFLSLTLGIIHFLYLSSPLTLSVIFFITKTQDSNQCNAFLEFNFWNFL